MKRLQQAVDGRRKERIVPTFRIQYVFGHWEGGA
jgi:hypothetical protein